MLETPTDPEQLGKKDEAQNVPETKMKADFVFVTCGTMYIDSRAWTDKVPLCKPSTTQTERDITL